MLTGRSAALLVLSIGLTGSPAVAATCNLTVQGAHVIDDETCTVTSAKGTTRVAVEDGSTIEIRRSILRARLAGDRSFAGHRRGATSYGQVVTADRPNDRICYFGQVAVLCVEP